MDYFRSHPILKPSQRCISCSFSQKWFYWSFQQRTINGSAFKQLSWSLFPWKNACLELWFQLLKLPPFCVTCSLNTHTTPLQCINNVLCYLPIRKILIKIWPLQHKPHFWHISLISFFFVFHNLFLFLSTDFLFTYISKTMFSYQVPSRAETFLWRSLFIMFLLADIWRISGFFFCEYDTIWTTAILSVSNERRKFFPLCCMYFNGIDFWCVCVVVCTLDIISHSYLI